MSVRRSEACRRSADDFHEQIYETISSLSYDGGAANFCAAVTKRLARSFCKGGPTATFERLSVMQQGIDDLRGKDDPVRRVNGGAAVTVYVGESRQGAEGAPAEHATARCASRLSLAASGGWIASRPTDGRAECPEQAKGEPPKAARVPM